MNSVPREIRDHPRKHRIPAISRGPAVLVHELRRSATGGDVIEVETTDLFDGSNLESVPGVLAIRQLDGHRLRVTVDHAATKLPAVVDAIGVAGGDVASAREVRLTFDEVFAELVARAGEEDDAAADVVAADLPADTEPGTAA